MNCTDCKKEITLSNSYPYTELAANHGVKDKRRCNECHENDIRNYTKNLEISAAEKYKK